MSEPINKIIKSLQLQLKSINDNNLIMLAMYFLYIESYSWHDCYKLFLEFLRKLNINDFTIKYKELPKSINLNTFYPSTNYLYYSEIYNLFMNEINSRNLDLDKLRNELLLFELL